MTRKQNAIVGRWRIIETALWDQEALDLVVPAHITFGSNGLGELQLIAMGASIDYRVTEREGKPFVEFSWFGDDEGDAVCGRGWARVEEEKLTGEVFIHQGDESSFAAIRDDEGRGLLTSRSSGRTRVSRPLRGKGRDTLRAAERTR